MSNWSTPNFRLADKRDNDIGRQGVGSKCVLSEAFQKGVNKAGITESVLLWSKFKADQSAEEQAAGKKTSKLKGIPKLEDANEAGTRNSSLAALSSTEETSVQDTGCGGARRGWQRLRSVPLKVSCSIPGKPARSRYWRTRRSRPRQDRRPQLQEEVPHRWMISQGLRYGKVMIHD